MALNKNVVAALKKIQETGRVTREAGEPLLKQNLIEVNTADVDTAGLAAARLTQSAIDQMPKPKNAPAVAVAGADGAAAVSAFMLITGAVPPESKRGFGGRDRGPSKYPFDQMEPNASFFVPVSDDMPNPVKTMGSAVTNATNKYREDTGTTQKVTRTKRDEHNKAVLVDGKKVREEVEVPVYNYPRKYIIRSVESGKVYGSWTAPADGALITRSK